MSRILATATAVPDHRLEQTDARNEMARLCTGNRALERLLPVFDHTGIETRYLLHPARWYATPHTFEERNEEYVTLGLALAERAGRECLSAAGLPPSAVTHLFFVTTTGLATPSLDAHLAARLGLGTDVRRSPLFGLGCAGGAGALVRATDVLRTDADEVALIVSLELCSLIFSSTAQTPTDLIGAALFGDGAVAVLLASRATDTAPEVRGRGSRLFPDAADLMGWRFTSDGMRLVLSPKIPRFVEANIASVVDEFLSACGVTREEITHYLLHPGGPKVMAAYQATLGVSDDALHVARETMRQYGNLSSAAVLFMLQHLQASGRPMRGDKGLMLALGPGFAAEMLLLSW